jgi:hypothetical protein
MFKLRKLLVSCIFTLLVIGLFLTCDDPNNPFSNNLGEKVVVEPPTINDISPVSGSYLRGTVTITGTAKAYIKVEKVEVYIFEDKANGQKEVKWTDSGIRLTGSLKLKEMKYDFDTTKYNGGNDGTIKMMFRIFDSTGKPVESVPLVYIIKNKPSVVKMAAPSDAEIIQLSYTPDADKIKELPKVYYGGDLRGSIVDRRGLRPGFPQIKLWPDGAEKTDPDRFKKDDSGNLLVPLEPLDDDPEYGWASLFLSGYDDMEKEGADQSVTPAGPGKYADRSILRVVNATTFNLQLAKYTIEIDPVNPDLRRIRYEHSTGKHEIYPAGKVFNFRIRTRDVAPDPPKGSIPSADPVPLDPNNPPWIEGFFPPKDFGTPNENTFIARDDPVKFIIFSSDTRPTVEINNDDISDDILDAKPNHYITEAMSKKIVQTLTVNPNFRLRLFVTFEKGGDLDKATLEYKHESVPAPVTLSWDPGCPVTGVPGTDKEGRDGKFFTYTAPGGPSSPFNKKTTEPFMLTFKVFLPGIDEKDALKYTYVVYMDGEDPTVKIYDIKGAAKEPAPGGAAKVSYTVNGNIQAIVERSDSSGIMPFRDNAGLGTKPPDDDNYPMVKWIVEEANAAQDEPPATGIIQSKLNAYKSNPNRSNLTFFTDMEETLASSLTSLPSGWVKRPLPDNEAKIEADKNDHFKLNTKYFTDKNISYLWVYVIAMDQVYNLGYTARKIYIDQNTDNPKPGIPSLSDKNAKGTAIADEKNLDVKVTIKVEGTGNTVTTEVDGNWIGSVTDIDNGKRNNVLGKNANISLTLADDDGINLDEGGVTIILTDLNKPPASKSPVTFGSANADSLKLLKEVINAGTKTDWSGTLSQEIMAEALYGKGVGIPTSLKDGMYSLRIIVKDDIKEKVEIKPFRTDGDTPTAVEKDFTYYFAVATEKPELTILKPDDGALGSKEPIDIYGTVKSRLDVQDVYITFSPDVVTPSLNSNSGPRLLTLWADAAYTKDRTQAVPDAEGFYTYYWISKGVVFHPDKPGGGVWFDDTYNGVRIYSVEAYDRLGYKSVKEQKVMVDDSAPDITLVEFNYGRPADKDGVLYLYGKVSFTVTASDAQGLYESTVNNVDMSGIKWWVLPATGWTSPTTGASTPSWGDDPIEYTNTALASRPRWTGGGNFRIDQARSGGQYTGVIDTRYLADDKTTVYKFYYMAMDKAGNTAMKTFILQPDIESFKVDQSKDYPFIYENTLNPLPNSVLGKDKLIISGTVGDADLFNPANTNKYVEIRFPGSVSAAGVPTWTNNWIPILVPSAYSTKDGGIDPAGAIVYKFDVSDTAKYTGANANAARTYLSGDGIKYYQIRVTDEADGPTDGGTKWYGKNPDEFMRTNAAYPNYNTAVWLKHDAVQKIFPSDSEAYIFFVDNTNPEIFFNMYDPAVGHENYIASRPTFSKWEQLKAALNNTPKYNKGNFVKEYKLIDLSMSWIAGDSLFTKVLLNSPKDPEITGEYPWDLSAFTPEDDTRLEATFRDAPQGLQVISFEATDMVPLTGRATWIFAKDTQGPEINFTNINRAIKRATIPDAAVATPTFPSNWPTNKTEWDSAWNGFSWNSVAWKTIITNWPSEYAFKAAAEVISALDKENKQSPSTVIGDENTPPVIQGTFQDEYSSIRKLVPADAKTYFYYRFKYKNGATVQPIPTSGLVTGIEPITLSPIGFTDSITDGKWIQKEIEKAGEKQSEKEADWIIVLNPENGFTGSDGENLVDIRVADTAENISEIYNVRFLVDRAPPLLGSYGVVPPNTTESIIPGDFRISKLNGVEQATYLALPEDQRVISAVVEAANQNSNANVFSVSGRANDYNLNNLRIIIGQDGYTSYTVTASVNIDPSLTSVTTYKSADDGEQRLTVTGPYNPNTKTAYNSTTEPPEWEWTFDILAKDVYGLRNAAGIGTDAEYSTRRFIRVTAADKAGKREGPVEWSFYLDTQKPVIEYTNIDLGRNGSSFESDVKLSVLVSDDTKIRDVYYIIGRWEYGAAGDNKWRWYNSTAKTWTLTETDLTNRTNWVKVFTDDENPKRLTTMDITINQAMLDAAGTKYPENLFNTEGQYRVDLYVIDFSIGNGNPHDTTKGDNTETTYKADGSIDKDTGFRDTGYNAKTGAGNASARVFYIDKKDPTLRWASTIEDKTYFRNEADGTDKGKVIFGFIAGDGNTLQNWTAVVRDKTGNIVETTDGTTKWDAGTGKTTTAIPEPLTVASGVTTPATTPDHKISDTSIYEQYFEIKPFMTKTATAGGDALDKGLADLPTYSITITVTDGAKRTSSITKQFTLDNTPPRFVQDKFNPLSYKYGDKDKPAATEITNLPGTPPKTESRVYSYDAIAGRLNIRGNTTDNSNQIKNVSYYVVNNADSPGFTSFPNPKDVTKWRYSGGTGDSAPAIKGDSDVTLIEIDQGTFAWTIMVPQTTLFLTGDTKAPNYVQKTTTGGKSIKGEDKNPGTYNDVNTSTWATITGRNVPTLKFADLNNINIGAGPTDIYGGEDVGLITVYVRAEDAAGNIEYDVLQYWIWPEGDRPIVTAINNPDSSKIQAERLLNGTIRLSGMAKDNERVKYVWFRVLDDKKVPYGTGTGTNGKKLTIPNWQDKDKTTGNPIGGNWEEAGGTQDSVDGKTIGSRRTVDDSLPDPEPGWYMANGGHSRDVSWWVYINTNGELDPTGTDESKQFTVEVRAQDVTYDSKNDVWMEYVTNGYRGMASAMTDVSKVDAWVVAGAPIFEDIKVAPVDSTTASTAPEQWDSIEKVHLRNRSSYKVTVKHSTGLSSIRWSPTFWDRSLNSNAGGFQANPRLDTLNLLELKDTTTANPEYVYVYRIGSEPATGTANLGSSYTTKIDYRNAFWTTMNNLDSKTDATPRMALTVKPRGMLGPGSVSLKANTKYMIWKWDDQLSSVNGGPFPCMVAGKHDPTHYSGSVHKDMKNSVFTQTSPATYNIGTAILIEAEPDPAPASQTVQYFKWDIIVDVRADLLLSDMEKDDTAYGNGTTARAGQVKNSVRYPVYLSASEVSKATPLTSRGDALLPIDNLDPHGMYTLNRKPAGTAVTIGGEAGDDGPVNGIARVVMWFQRANSAEGVSWHERAPKPETSLPEGTFTAYTSGGPTWWQDVKVLPAGATKPALGAQNNGSGGDSAIVIDVNNPSVGKPGWGHTLPMGFADGGLGKLWYVEINSYGIESGPIDLHYVVIDKAGNYKHYKERLVIMNDVAVIDRIKLATDIRHSSWTGMTPNMAINNFAASGKKIDDKAETSDPSLWPILNNIRSKALNSGDDDDLKNDVKKGISDWVSASALGAGKVIDFNVRNNLFAMRVETTKPPKTKTRNFRLEYVSSARLMSDTATQASGQRLTDIKAGRVYVINDRGDARWGAIGAEGDGGNWQRGYAFIAAVDGRDNGPDGLPNTADDLIKITGTGSAWELNYGYPAIRQQGSTETFSQTGIPNALQLADARYPLKSNYGDPDAESAEFVYASAAFGANPNAATGNSIVDCSGPNDAAWPPALGVNPVEGKNYSLFILRVFDGPEADLFGDFTILRVRVNNDDKTVPFAQLYDLNPRTEGQDRSNIAQDSTTVEQRRSVSPMFIGEGTSSNRTKGGLWNIAADLGAIDKPGHIEPRRVTTYTAAQEPYRTQQHSLSSAQMGGAATAADASITKPFADPAGFFGTDTVSGRVVLRGYAEDDQRVQRVNLVIGTETITILDYPSGGTTAGNPADSADYMSPKTGMLAIPTTQAANVYYTDSIDLYRHRVEWAYIWDTEAIPASTVVGNNIIVSVVSYNRNGATGAGIKDRSGEIRAPGDPHVNTPDLNKPFEATRPNTSPFNPGFPANLNKYNYITVNLRPYITGFLRNKTLFSHDTRSRQGRYMFYREETAVLKGFNLSTGTASINGTAVTTGNVPAADLNSYGIAAANNNRYRLVTIGANAVTGNGLVTYSLGTGRDAVNTGGERTRAVAPATPVRPAYIMPWNIEYSPGVDGSRLWDDFTQVHIWQSNDSTNGPDGGRFPKGGDNMEVFDPAMSIDPKNGNLWESHNEGGGNGGNTGSTKVSNNNGVASFLVASFIDPITNSDIYISPRDSGYNGNNFAYTVWTASSIIGKPGGGQEWRNFGGIWINGPEGSNVDHTQAVGTTANNGFNAAASVSARSQYHGESTFYNSYPYTGNNTTPNPNLPVGGPALNQFKNPHIVTDYRDGSDHIHVSYYDTKDGSIKYRYNRRGGPGTITGGTGGNQYNGLSNALTNVPRAWTNLDGGFDAEDQNSASNAGTFAGVTISNANTRIVNYAERSALTEANRSNAGEYNSIAVTSQGYPVVAYYDKTKQKLKLAISNNTVPILAANWRIEENVIPADKQLAFTGTGEHVSMKIDTRVTPNVVHIAAMNSMNKTLVYIRGTLGADRSYTNTALQVVDSVGSVGRWCAISLDSDGYPWISYQDESYQGSRDGIKLAHYNPSRYYKGSNTTANGAIIDEPHRRGQDVDMLNVNIAGWEAMHVPTRFRVENARQGMECYPTRNYTGTPAPNPAAKFWRGAVGYLGQDYFRAAYYVE